MPSVFDSNVAQIGYTNTKIDETQGRNKRSLAEPREELKIYQQIEELLDYESMISLLAVHEERLFQNPKKNTIPKDRSGGYCEELKIFYVIDSNGVFLPVLQKDDDKLKDVRNIKEYFKLKKMPEENTNTEPAKLDDSMKSDQALLPETNWSPKNAAVNNTKDNQVIRHNLPFVGCSSENLLSLGGSSSHLAFFDSPTAPRLLSALDAFSIDEIKGMTPETIKDLSSRTITQQELNFIKERFGSRMAFVVKDKSGLGSENNGHHDPLDQPTFGKATNEPKDTTTNIKWTSKIAKYQSNHPSSSSMANDKNSSHVFGTFGAETTNNSKGRNPFIRPY